MIKKFEDKKHFSSMLDFIIGDCGSGKSTLACAYAQKYIRKGYNVYCNFYIEGCRKFTVEDLMTFDFGVGAVIIFDEIASNGLASRGETYKKSNSEKVIEFFTTYRHYKVEHIIIISPSFQDCIPVVRSRVATITVCKSPVILNLLLFPLNIPLLIQQKNPIKLTLRKQILKKIDIVGEGGSGEPREIYFWNVLYRAYTIQNFWYKYFDSFTQKILYNKEWEYWLPEQKEEEKEEKEKKKLNLKETYIVAATFISKILKKKL